MTGISGAAARRPATISASARISATVTGVASALAFTAKPAARTAVITAAASSTSRTARFNNSRMPPCSPTPGSGQATPVCYGQGRTMTEEYGMLEISFAKPELPKSGVLVLPLAVGAAPAGHAAALDKALDGGLTRALEAAEFKGKKGSQANLLAPKGFKRVLVLGTGKADAPRGAEELGGAIAAALPRESEAAVLAEAFSPEQAAAIGFGARLRAYRFDKYRTTQKDDEKQKLRHLPILTPEPRKAAAAYEQLEALAH